MKRFLLIDRETNKHTQYSNFEFNLSFFIVFVSGMAFGIAVFIIIK